MGRLRRRLAALVGLGSCCSAQVLPRPAESPASYEALRLLRSLGLNESDEAQLQALRALNDELGAGGLPGGAEVRRLLQELFVGHLRLASAARVLPVSMTFQGHLRCSGKDGQHPPQAPAAAPLLHRLHFRGLRPRFELACLEWPPMDMTAALERSGLGRCASAWSFRHAEPYEAASRWGVDNYRQEIRGDLRLLRHEFPALRGQFDLVFCSSVLEHVEDPFEAMASLAFLLAPGGQLVLEAPFLQAFHGGGFFQYPDFWRFSHQGLAAMASRAGLQRVALNVSLVGAARVAGAVLGLGPCDFEAADRERTAMAAAGEYFAVAHLVARKHPAWTEPSEPALREHTAQRRWRLGRA